MKSLFQQAKIIENAQRHFQCSLFGCFEYVPYTALTIVLIIKTINVKLVEKLQFSLFLISCCQGILNSSWLSWYLVLKVACLHVSFTAYENFYKLSKMYCLLIWFSSFQPPEVSENRDPTIKHIFTYTLISSSISTYVIDLFLVIHFT